MKNGRRPKFEEKVNTYLAAAQVSARLQWRACGCAAGHVTAVGVHGRHGEEQHVDDNVFHCRRIRHCVTKGFRLGFGSDDLQTGSG